MKKYLKNLVILSLCTMGLQTMVVAQKIEDVKIPVNFIRLPYHKLPDKVKTYNAEIVGQSKFGNDLTAENYIKTYLITLKGYDRNTEKPDLLIKLNLPSGMVLNELDYDTPTKPRLNENLQWEVYTSCVYRVRYEFPAMELTLTTSEGQIIKRKVGYKKKKYTFGSTAFATRYTSKSLLDAAWDEKKDELLKGFERALYEDALSKVSKILTEYCLQPYQVDVKIAAIPDSKKNGEHNYDDFNKAKDLMTEGLKLIANDKIANINKLIQPKYEEVRAKIKPAIEIWEKMLQESNIEDKKARVDARVTREIYFNLAKAYMWIDEYARAEEYYQLRVKEGGQNSVLEMGKGLNEFSKLLDDQEKRYIQNSWRNIYINEGEVVESVTKAQSREKRKNLTEQSISESTGEEEEFKIDTTKYALIHFYMPKAPGGINKNRYGIFLNDVLVGEVKGGEKMVYKIFSTGELKILSKKMAGEGEGEKDRKGLLKPKDESIDINVRAGEKYFIKVAWLNGIFKQQQELEGEKDYKSFSSTATIAQEDIEDPIPNLSIALQLEK